MYEERTNVDEEGMRHFKERHIDRIKKQVIEEKLQEQKDWYSVPSSTYIYVCVCVSKNVMKTLKKKPAYMKFEPKVLQDAGLAREFRAQGLL